MKRPTSMRLVRPAALALLFGLALALGLGSTSWAYPGRRDNAIQAQQGGTVPARQANLAITKSGVWTGNEIVFTMRVTNAGPALATRVILVDPLPGNTIYRSVTSNRGRCRFDNDVIVCNLAGLPTDQEAVVELRVRVTGSSVTTVQNLAMVSSAVFDPDTRNNLAELVITRP